MPLPRLPQEILDMILEFVFECPRHQWASKKTPCAQWHNPTQLPQLLRLRLVNRLFRDQLTKSLFNHLTFKGEHRAQTIQEISRLDLARFVRVLKIEVSPKDMGGLSKQASHSLAPPEQKLIAYFEAMPLSMSPILRRFAKVKTLHVDMTYAGMYNKSVPKNKLVGSALEALCKAVKKGNMSDLRELVFGVPYDGGYTNFFKDIDNPKYKKMMQSTSRGIRAASLKLFDHEGQYTTWSYF